MENEIKSEVSLAICLAMIELLKTNTIPKETSPASGLIQSQLNIAFTGCLKRFGNNLNQDGLNEIGSEITKLLDNQ